MIRRYAAPLLAIAVSACVAFTDSGEPAPSECPESVAHRGLSQAAPENTLAALYAAAASGVDAVEMDVRFTATDVPMLMHDPTVDRTTNGTGTIAAKTVTQMRALDAGDWLTGVYDAEKVPTWYEALRVLKPFDVDVLVEIKGTATAAEIGAFTSRITSLGMTNRVIVSSFVAANLTIVTVKLPTVRLSLLTVDIHADPVAAAQAVGATYYQPRHDGLTAAHVQALHAAGIRVVPWTADQSADWRRLTNLGVDGIITNRAATYEGWTVGVCG